MGRQNKHGPPFQSDTDSSPLPGVHARALAGARETEHHAKRKVFLLHSLEDGVGGFSSLSWKNGFNVFCERFFRMC